MFTNDRLIESAFRTVHDFNVIWWHLVLKRNANVARKVCIPWYTESTPWAIVKKDLKSHPEILPETDQSIIHRVLPEIIDLSSWDTSSSPLAPVCGQSPLGN
jgi:hypothetical protein